MDKNSANGGPPSYTTALAPASASTSTSAPSQPSAAPPAAAAAPLIISDVAGLSINDSDSAEPARRTEDVPPGVTLKEANDPASTYSQTRVALELPLVTATKRIPSPLAQSAPLAPFLLHCTLFASYDLNSPHPVPLRQVGCPAQHSRGEASATSKTKVSQSVSKLRKRLGVQIPVSYLGSPGFNPSSATPSSPYDGVHAFLSHPHPRNGAEMVARSGNVSRYRRVSLFQAQAREMTGIVSRPLVERVLSVMYAGQGIYDPMAAFPAEAVLRYSNKASVADSNSPAGDDGEQKTGWLAKLKAKAKAGSSSGNDKVSGMSGSHQLEHVKSAESVRDASAANDGQAADVRTVKASMVFATIDLLAPPPRLLETGGPYPIEMNKASDADLATSARLISEFDRGSDEERFQKFYFTPSAADDQLCAGMLRALERRGAIWVEAGRLITPSSRNPNPRERARFLVKGLFPERFVYRCKYYRARKFEPMPNDLTVKEVKRFGSPLIVHLVQERTGNEGIDLRDYLASRGPGHGDDWEWDEDDNLMLNSAAVEGEGGAAPPDYVSTQREMLGGYGIETQRAKALIEAEQDFLEGWSIGVTEEPFRNGGFFENVGTGVGLWALAAF
ncbi:hypothetical protein PHBOTO_003459 [Pseudozyma hubeiensis]|nr:hypothetical protein PHBOTO_003459 [Pseudozyma hubeiensis]